ncbi:hypothetical protein AUR64_08710 [Haloprofundus marisrubri]|uniref:Uncharacterized protein n=1 Tax=Haloprofundus marisrubri TaxID=1514971 RepID=A0A0W1R947_9EURY|nr:hypothetical protein [Haloprofundus marisrubri]KTG09712.1 hypothetical protein AUR64_08710 [Haloprofundus marisrubri]
MTSTVLDAALCLLLVSAAAVTLASVPSDSPELATDTDASQVAETLSTSTAEIGYTLAPGARRANDSERFPVTDGLVFERYAHGTLAQLLAESTLATPTVGDERLTHTGDDFQQQARAAVAQSIPPRTHIVADWRPHPGSSVGSKTTVGEAPPPSADVHVAVLTVPTATALDEDMVARRAISDGFAGVATVVSERLVRTWFPPKRTRLALGDDYPTSSLVRYRYHRAAELTGATLPTTLNRSTVSTANARLVSALEPRVESDLREQFDSPVGAAAGLSDGRVRITVRRWSA